jgi:hypothetical protein
VEDPDKPPIQLPPVDDTYQTIADKVGFVPNSRKSDNVYQAKFLGAALAIVVPFTAVSFEVGGWGPWWIGALLGCLAGLLGGLMISGTILAIKNLKR